MYNFYDFSKKLSMSFETKDELFAYCKYLIGPLAYQPYRTIDAFFGKISLCDNDTYFDGFEYNFRPVRVYNGEKVMDLRMFKDEILAAGNYYKPYPVRETPNFEGFMFPNHPRRFHYHQLIVDSRNPEMKGFTRTSNKNWWWYEREYPEVTRSWKDQTKSRKQWAKKKKRPLYRNEMISDEKCLLEEEDYQESLCDWLYPDLSEWN